MCKHNWKGADNMRFVLGNNKGANADVFCALCDMGALTSENGIMLFHTIAKVEWRD